MTLKVPTIFSAIDKVTGPMRRMTGSVHSFVGSAEAGVARGERLFRRLTPAISETTKQFFSFASAAAIAGTVIGGINFSVKAIKDYETAVQSFRTIVGGTDEEFAPFQKQLNQVAKDLKKSSIDVAGAAESIAGLNAKFAETPAAIAAVTKSTIVLAKASRDDLASSAQSLVGIMNQFNLQAEESNRVINVLAAGQAVGASNIKQTAQSFVNFGSVAAGANITLEESVALVQTLGKFSLFGAEAGTKLRGSVLKLQQAGVGYASGVFNINDALLEARKRIDRLKTAKQQDAALTKMFGAENIATGRILLSNIEVYKDFVKGVSNTNEAQKAADINSRTLTVALGELRDSWINLITTSDDTTTSLNTTKKAIGFVTRNLDTIVSIGSNVLLFFVGWKALLIASRIAIGAYNIALGVMGVVSTSASVAIGRNALALGAYKTTLWIATSAQWAFNAAMTANPIGLIIVGIGVLIGLVTAVVLKWNDWGAALSLAMGPLGMIISLIQSFRRNWDLIKESFKTGGILGGLKMIGKVLIDSVLMPIQQVLKLIHNITGAAWAARGANMLQQGRELLGINTETDESGEPLRPAINPDARRQQGTSNNARVDLNVNDPFGLLGLQQQQQQNNFVQVNIGSTNPGTFN